MVSLAASSSILTPLLSFGLSPCSCSAAAACMGPSPPNEGEEEEVERGSSSPPNATPPPPSVPLVEDWEAEECCLKVTRGMGGSVA